MSLQEPTHRDAPNTSLKSSAYADLPSVHALAEDAALARWLQRLPRPVVVSAIRQVLQTYRDALARGAAPAISRRRILGEVDARLERQQRPALGEAINGTGILIHTGLGRAPLSSAAIEAIGQACCGYTPLEIDLESGRRGHRCDAVAEQLCRLTGAEAALVVNNNAAALLLALNTLASGCEVVVSRGEQIEIGGSFRLPEVMQASGAELREVGTTNKTRTGDYEAAIGERTGALLKVHCSNYQIAGFAESAGIEQLVEVGRRRGVPVIHDIGSGAWTDLSAYGLADEPVARRSVEAGADVVLFSGDKLLGGPQAGIVVGARQPIQAMATNPLARALRAGKLTFAALSATLSALEHPERAIEELPLWRMATAGVERLRQRAEPIAGAIHQRGGGAEAEVVESTAYLGGGALPGQGIDSVAVAVRSERLSDEQLARRLRRGDPPVVARLHNRRLLVDLRAVLPHQDPALTDALLTALER